LQTIDAVAEKFGTGMLQMGMSRQRGE